MKCGNHLRVGVRSKNATVWYRFACRPLVQNFYLTQFRSGSGALPLKQKIPAGTISKAMPWTQNSRRIRRRVAILRACYRAQKPRNPENAESKKKTKNTKSPTPGWPLKLRKIYRKSTKLSHKWPCLYFCLLFCFRGPTGDGGFCVSYIFAILGFLGSM